MNAPAAPRRPCPVCGAQVAPGTEFCAVCGTYLGWTEPEPPAVPAPPDPPAPVRPNAAEQPAAAAPRSRNQPGEADQPVAVQPARPVAARPQLQDTGPIELRDGTICQNCGTVNEPDRRLCRRCAAPLGGEQQTVRAARRRKWRFGGSGRLTRRLVVLLLAAVLLVAGVALYPLGERLVQDILDKTGTAEPVATTSVRAGAQVPGHPAGAAVDGVSNRYWGAPAPGSWIEVGFATPIRLVDVLVHTGASNRPRPYRAQARPVLLELVVTTADGEVSRVPARLVDRPGPQRISTGISDVVRVRIVTREIAGAAPGRHVALGELEFFRRG